MTVLRAALSSVNRGESKPYHRSGNLMNAYQLSEGLDSMMSFINPWIQGAQVGTSTNYIFQHEEAVSFL